MSKKSKIIEYLDDLYHTTGKEWVKKNSLPINYAKNSRLAFGGSIAMAISNRRPAKIPGDLDFFTDCKEDAEEFILKIMGFLGNRKNTWYDMRFNHETEYVLDGVSDHIRIKVPFWLPICVMVLKDPIRKFYKHGMAVQYFDDVVKAAKEATEIDGKERTSNYSFKYDIERDFGPPVDPLTGGKWDLDLYMKNTTQEKGKVLIT